MMQRIFDFISALDTAADRLPAWMLALRDTNLSGLTRLTRVIGDVWHTITGSPDWLSQQAESPRDVRRRRERAEEVPVSERWRCWLHARYSLTASTRLAAEVMVLLVGGSLAFGASFPITNPPANLLFVATVLTTTAEVLGGIAGILFAVIVFGIQFQGERLGRLSFLVRYLRRHEGLLPLAGLALAVVGSNIIVSLMSGRLPNAAVPLAIADCLLVPLVLWVVLYLLHRMVILVSERAVETYLPGLAWEYETAMDEEVVHAGRIRRYVDAVQKAGLRYKSGTGIVDLDPTSTVHFRISHSGCVADVNLTELAALGTFLQDYCPGYDATVGLGPGDRTHDDRNLIREDFHTALLLRVQRTGGGECRTVRVGLPNDVQMHVAGRLRRVFRLGPSRRRDVIQVLNEFSGVLTDQAATGHVRDFGDSLQVQEHLIALRLKRPETAKAEQSLYRDGLPDYLGNFVYSEMAHNVVRSGDHDRIFELLRFACRVMGLAIDHRDAALFDRAGSIVAHVYRESTPDRDLADYVGRTIDSVVLAVLNRFAYPQSRRFVADIVAAEMMVLRAALAWVLQLLDAAVRSERIEDVRSFHDRLWRWDRHRNRRFVPPVGPDVVPPILREVYDLHMALDIVFAAWCLHVVRERMPGGNAARVLFTEFRNQLGTRHEILRVWEVIHTRPYAVDGLADCFSAGSWTFPAPDRAGVTRGSWGRYDAWVTQGLIALLLCTDPGSPGQLPEYFNRPPRVFPPDESLIRNEAAALFADKAVPAGLLGLSSGNDAEAVQSVVDLCNGRTCRRKCELLRQLVKSPIDPARRGHLAAEIASALPGNRGLVSLINRIGELTRDASCWPLRVRLRGDLRKETVRQRNTGPTHYGEVFAEWLDSQESTRMAWITETVAERVEGIGDLGEISEAIQEVVQWLVERGFTATMVLLPRDTRFIRQLTDSPDWQPHDGEPLGDQHIGTWRGLHIAAWPYESGSSIAVVDTRVFYGVAAADSHTFLEVKLEERNEDDHAQLLADAEVQNDPAKIPDESAVTVLATVTMLPRIGIADPRAAARIELDLSRLGYALQPGENTYHRPGCPRLLADKPITYTLMIYMEGDREHRLACGECRPDEWNDDG